MKRQMKGTPVLAVLVEAWVEIGSPCTGRRKQKEEQTHSSLTC